VTLIGRERESAQLLDRLGSSRLVTVIGPGGVGKTALAQHVAAEAASRFELGVHTVDLTRVDSADAVGGAMAGQLGFVSFRALLDSPTEQSALVLVDNCEHLVDAAAAAIGELLAACEAPAVLATSRSPLEIATRVNDDVGVLQRPRYRGARRHRSLVETIRWSYDLLDAGEARLLDRLAVFAGPFPVEVARQIVAFDVTELDHFTDRSTRCSTPR
jgi:predicted ATPase